MSRVSDEVFRVLACSTRNCFAFLILAMKRFAIQRFSCSENQINIQGVRGTERFRVIIVKLKDSGHTSNGKET